MPLNVVLFEPEIPPNTGNVIRLCANAGARLHLVKPLGFRLDARAVRRSGLDYAELAEVRVHDDFAACLASLGRGAPADRPALVCADDEGGGCPRPHRLCRGDVVVFGPETRGLPDDLLQACPPERRLRIPMRPMRAASTCRMQWPWSCTRPGASSAGAAQRPLRPPTGFRS